MLTSTPLSGVYLLPQNIMGDARGVFQVAWRHSDMQDLSLDTHIEQINIVSTRVAGTIRGMHFQYPPFDETKTIRVLRGTIWDVIVDLREDSPTCGKWHGICLAEHDGQAIYIPKGCAHGYQTLTDDTVVCYTTSNTYQPQHAGGFRWDDELFGIQWRMTPTHIDARDRSYMNFSWQIAPRRFS